MTKRSKYFPLLNEPTSNSIKAVIETPSRGERFAPNPSQKPAGSSPALRIACPACYAPAGSYCTKLVDYKLVQQTIAHKRRREEEERTR